MSNTPQACSLSPKAINDPSLKVILKTSQPTSDWHLVTPTVAADGLTATIDIKKEKLGPGCYLGTVTASGVAYPIPDFAVAPTPTITKATRAFNKIEIEGKELFDMPDSKFPICFKVFAETDGAAGAKVVTNVKTDSTGAKSSFEFASFPATDEVWDVEVFSGPGDAKAILKMEKK